MPLYDQVEDDPNFEAQDEEFEADLDRKYALVGVYREIAKNGVFPEDGSEEVQIVNAEAIKWAKGQIRACMSGEEPAQNGLSAEEADQFRRVVPLMEQLISKLQGGQAPQAAPAARQAAPLQRPMLPRRQPAPAPQAQQARPQAQGRQAAKPATKKPSPRRQQPPTSDDEDEPARVRIGTVVPRNHPFPNRATTEAQSIALSSIAASQRNPNNVLSQDGRAFVQSGDQNSSHVLLVSERDE